VSDGANRIRDINTARSFRGTLRRALDVVHRRCRHETCFVPAHRCQGDHVVAWSVGGPTTQDNGRLGCGPHNRWWYATGRSTRPPGDPPPPTEHAAAGPDEPGADPPPTSTPDEERNAPATRVTVRLALAPDPDVRIDVGDRRHTIDLHPARADDRWRHYPVGTAA
jgi:hypothetical protein